MASLFVSVLFILSNQLVGQGTWTAVTALAPDSNYGNMLLVSDGRILAKTQAGGNDSVGNIWNVLTPKIMAVILTEHGHVQF